MSTPNSYDSSLKHFNRLRRAIIRLEEALTSFSKEEITDHAYIAAMLGHHMFDWVKHDRGEQNHDFRNMMTKRHQYLGILHDICNAVKHVTVSVPMSDVGATAVHTSVSFSPEAIQLLDKMIEDPNATHQVQGKEFLYNIVKAGTHNLLESLKDTEKFWLDFFVSEKVQVDTVIYIPKSKANPNVDNPLAINIKKIIDSAPQNMGENPAWLGEARSYLNEWDAIKTASRFPGQLSLHSAIPAQRRIAASSLIALLYEALNDTQKKK